jgi:hypothetical protein
MFDLRNDSLPVEMEEDIEEVGSNDVRMLHEFNNKINTEPVYKMTVELARGKFETLDIYLDSKPEELAYQFCREKNLDFKAMFYLIKEINKLIGKEETSNFGINKLKDYNKMKQATQVNQHTESKHTVLTGLDLNNKDLSISSKNSRIPTEQSGKGIVTTYKPKTAKKIPGNKLVSNLYYNTYKNKQTDTSANKTFESKSIDANVQQQASLIISKIKEDASKFENMYKRAHDEEKSKMGTSLSQARSKSLGYLTTNKSKNILTNVSRDQVINYGERLYQKGLKLKQETNKKIDNIKYQIAEKNSKVYTYKPSLNLSKESLQYVKIF